jgi:hypothetical protein
MSSETAIHVRYVDWTRADSRWFPMRAAERREYLESSPFSLGKTAPSA